MPLAKYSPTISDAYKKDQTWFDSYIDPENPGYDLDGFNKYGYDQNGVDRAGFTEADYMASEEEESGISLYFDTYFMFVNYKPNTGGM